VDKKQVSKTREVLSGSSATADRTGDLKRLVAPFVQRRSLLLSLCFVAFVLRLFHLDYQSLWYDEGFSWWLSSQSLDEIIARTAADIHPPLYYLVLHFWMIAVGASEFALRYLSLGAGVLLAPAFFILARRLLNEPVAWLAVAGGVEPALDEPPTGRTS